MTHEEFINAIAASVQKYAPQFGIKVCSPVIAQAILESGWGTTNKAKYHNYFGMKYREGRLTCHSGTFVDGSQEQLSNGQYVPVKDQWYKFDSLDKGVLGYFQFINTKNYANLKGVTDPRTYLENIRNDGYATSLKYVDNLMRVITTNNLTRFDGVSTEAAPKATDEPNIKSGYSCHASNHGGTRSTANIQYAVVHYTGNKTDTALNNVKYFHGTANIKASAHYFVDSNDIYRSVDDNVIAWAVGGNYGGGAFYKKCTNANSISIELCSQNGAITEATQKNAITLLRYLMKKYNIPIDRVIRHKDVNGKKCPGWTLATDAEFAAFKAKIANSSSTPTTPAPVVNNEFKAYTIRINCDALNIRSGPGTKYKVVGVIKDHGIYTIVQEENGWGKLKSGAGWISLKYTRKP